MALHLILGGAKSGKTRHALNLAQNITDEWADDYFENHPKKPYYIATCPSIFDGEPDVEMQAKIAAHQLERADTFITIEETLFITQTLSQLPNDAVIIIDDMTMWLNNLLYKECDLPQYCTQLLAYIVQSEQIIIMIAAEMSFAPIADNALTRAFVNHNGKFNQECATIAQSVCLMVAGIALNIKNDDTM